MALYLLSDRDVTKQISDGRRMEQVEIADSGYEAARRSILQRYSQDSQAYAAISYAQLVELLHSASSTNAEAAWDLASEQLQLCQEQLWRGFRARDRSHVVTLDEDMPLLQFRETPTIQLPSPRTIPEVLPLNATTLASVETGNHYLYVLSPTDEIFIYVTPLTIADLFFPDRDALRNSVRHPQISPNGDPVQSAGEICIFGGKQAAAVLFNTRSGHYQPPPRSALAMRRACRNALNVSDERIFPLVVSPHPHERAHDGI
jgi:hypothetical protein